MTGTVRIGPPGQTNAIAYGFDSVWVAYYDRQGNHLVRVNPTTLRVMSDIAMQGGPSWETGGGGLATGDGSVWVTGTFPPHLSARLLEVDPMNDEILASVDLGPGFGADVVVDAAGVWVLVIGARRGPDQMRLVRVDADTGRVTATSQLHYGYGHLLYAIDGWVIAQTYETHGFMVGDAYLSLVEPSTGRVVGARRAGWSLPVVGDDQMWAVSKHGLVRLDPENGAVLHQFVVPYDHRWIAAVGDDGVWFLDKHAVLHHLRARDGGIDVSIRTRSGANAVATSTNALWLLGYDGTLTRVSIG